MRQRCFVRLAMPQTAARQISTVGRIKNSGTFPRAERTPPKRGDGASGGPCRSAGSATRSSRSRPPPADPTRSPGRGTRGSCRTRSVPRRGDGVRRESRRRPRSSAHVVRRALLRRSRQRSRRECRAGPPPGPCATDKNACQPLAPAPGTTKSAVSVQILSAPVRPSAWP